jgi:hypothetical protein
VCITPSTFLRAPRATSIVDREGADTMTSTKPLRGARRLVAMRASTSRASALALALVLSSLSSASPASAPLRVAFDASTGDVDAYASPRLAAMARAFDANPAFEVVSGSNAPSDASTSPADIVWETAPGATPSALRSGQRANHFPGIGALASKSALAHLASSPGRAPVTLTQHSTEDDITRAFRDARDVPDAWLVKRSTHGGVRTLRPHDADAAADDDDEPPIRPSVVDPTERAARAALARGHIIQRRVPNLLRVDGRAFDLGVYVLLRGRGRAPSTTTTIRRSADSIGSPGSWSAMAFDETLLRFVGDEAVHDAVGALYPAAWDLPSLASRGAGNADARFSPTAWRALSRFLADEGYGDAAAAALRRDALDVVAASLDAAAPIVASAIEDAGRDVYPDGAGHFFEMLRFDFVVRVSPENALVPTLVEVNASPNVKPASAPQGLVLDRLCAAVAEAMASDDAVPDGFDPVPLEDDGALRVLHEPSDVRGRTLLTHGNRGQDCEWSAWGEWGACPAWCTRVRTRNATYVQSWTGEHCVGTGRETEPCTGGDCVAASPSPPPTPPSPPMPPPPSTSSTFERILEFPALDGEFGVAAQDALVAAVAARSGAATSTVTLVSHGAHATATARVSPLGGASVDDVREDEWRAMADALAADANVAADRTSLARNASVAAIRATVIRFGSVRSAREHAARLARAMAGGDAGDRYLYDANDASAFAFAAAARDAGLVVSAVIDSRAVVSATVRVQVEALAGEDVAAIVADAEATLAARVADGTVSSDLAAAGVPGGVRTGYLEAHDKVTWGSDVEEDDSGDGGGPRGGAALRSSASSAATKYGTLGVVGKVFRAGVAVGAAMCAA